MKNRSLLILAAFSLATWFALAQDNQAPTLADIARQKRAQKSKKVITSEDMKAAPEEPAPATTEAEAVTEAKVAAPKSSEAIAAAEAKVADLRDRELLLNKNIARFETSMSKATEEGNEDRKKTYQESIDSAKASLETTTQQRIAAEKELDQMKVEAAAAAGAAAARKKPARKPAASTPKS
jgi:hypothetical protein